MAYLAKVARADAIAVILKLKGEGYATYVAHNLPNETKWTEGLPAAMLTKAMADRASAQATSDVRLMLSDGRAADTLGVAPVVWNAQVVGGLAAMLVGRAFTPEDLTALTRVGDLIGLELAEANALWRAQRQGQDAEAKLKASRDLQAIIRKERDPEQLLERATAQLADVFGADGVSILLAAAEGELSVRTSRGLSDAAKLDRKRIGEGISGTVAQTGRSMLLSGHVQGGSDPTASESMIAPLRSNGRTLGVVNVKHRASQERYGQTQVDSLTQAASEIAAAYLTAGEFQRAEEDRRQALVLYELSRFSTLGNDPHNDLESAVAMLADNLRHDAVGVWAAEEHHLHLRAARRVERAAPHLAGAARWRRAGAHRCRARARRLPAGARPRSRRARAPAREGGPRCARDPLGRPPVHGGAAADRRGRGAQPAGDRRAPCGRPAPAERVGRRLRGDRLGAAARAIRRAGGHPDHRRRLAERGTAFGRVERESHPSLRRRAGRGDDRGRRQGLRVERAADRRRARALRHRRDARTRRRGGRAARDTHRAWPRGE